MGQSENYCSTAAALPEQKSDPLQVASFKTCDTMIYAKISTSLFLIESDGGGARGILSTHSGSTTVPLQNKQSK